jgi:O-antigen ligase
MPFAYGFIAALGEGSADPDAGGSLLIRANGPFSDMACYAVIGGISLVLLLFLRRAMGSNMEPWRRGVHWLGVSAALLQCLLPFMRMAIISLVLLALIDGFLVRGARKRLIRFSVVGLMAVAFWTVQLLAPGVSEDRTRPDNLLQRVSQQEQTLAVFLDHPLFGVGMGNFNRTVQDPRYLSAFGGEEAAGFPHSSPGAALAETGLAGFVPYVAANLLMLAAFLEVRRRSAEPWVGKYLLYLFLIFELNGLSMTLVYFPDVNMWFALAGASMYAYALSAPAPGPWPVAAGGGQ